MVNRKILPSLTTITPGEWRNKIKEIDELGLKEISLFPTCLNIEERRELYGLLENTGIVSIPHVHLRGQDTESWELDYLVEKFKTQVFNIHPTEVINFVKGNEKYKDRIYVENLLMDDNFKEVINYCAGACIDFSHWEDYGFMKKFPNYGELPELLKKYKIGVNHISAVKKEIVHYHDNFYNQDFYNYSDHNLTDLAELDYVKKYKDYFADIISIELENPLKRQLEAKEYLEKILDVS
jgi:hypothetical protein